MAPLLLLVGPVTFLSQSLTFSALMVLLGRADCIPVHIVRLDGVPWLPILLSPAWLVTLLRSF